MIHRVVLLLFIFLICFVCVVVFTSPRGLTFTWWGCCGWCFWHNPTELAHFLKFCSCVYFCHCGPFRDPQTHVTGRSLGDIWMEHTSCVIEMSFDWFWIFNNQSAAVVWEWKTGHQTTRKRLPHSSCYTSVIMFRAKHNSLYQKYKSDSFLTNTNTTYCLKSGNRRSVTYSRL